MVYQIRTYLTEDGRSPYDDWLDGLDRKVRARVQTRISRMELGNLGDHKPLKGCDSKLYEARLFFGPGYRVYFGIEGKTVVILLCGGDKGTQARDVGTAKELWDDYRGRTDEEG